MVIGLPARHATAYLRLSSESYAGKDAALSGPKLLSYWHTEKDAVMVPILPYLPKPPGTKLPRRDAYTVTLKPVALLLAADFMPPS